MSLLIKIFNRVNKINIKTIYFNLKYLPFSQAIKFPILISRNVYLKKTKGKIIIDHPTKFGLIKIGYGDLGIFDKKRSRSIWHVAGEVVFKGKASIGHGSKLSVSESGSLILGDNFKITAESSIVSHNRIEFGKNSLLSWDILVMDTDFHKIKSLTGNIIINPSKEIIIGDNVWVGCKSLILKGAIIPNNTVIGANSTVSKRLMDENSVYAGQPARLLKNDVIWEE